VELSVVTLISSSLGYIESTHFKINVSLMLLSN
jgi:hypothetical protein